MLIDLVQSCQQGLVMFEALIFGELKNPLFLLELRSDQSPRLFGVRQVGES